MQHDWAAAIAIRRPSGLTLGAYYMGWVGHEDAWKEDHESERPHPTEWEGLYHRLNEYLPAFGTSHWDGRSHDYGDYYLFDEWSANAEISITVSRIEFLTKDLVSGIQRILTDGYAHWYVWVVLELNPSDYSIASDALDIYSDHVVEKWDRVLLAEQFGDRLKI